MEGLTGTLCNEQREHLFKMSLELAEAPRMEVIRHKYRQLEVYATDVQQEQMNSCTDIKVTRCVHL